MNKHCDRTDWAFGDTGSPFSRVILPQTLSCAPDFREAVRSLLTTPMVRAMIQRGANCVRLNCAHDTPEIWQRMIDHVHRAAQETGTPCKIMMDLAGTNIRTGTVLAPLETRRVFRGDQILLLRSQLEHDGGAIAVDVLVRTGCRGGTPGWGQSPHPPLIPMS